MSSTIRLDSGADRRGHRQDRRNNSRSALDRGYSEASGRCRSSRRSQQLFRALLDGFHVERCVHVAPVDPASRRSSELEVEHGRRRVGDVGETLAKPPRQNRGRSHPATSQETARPSSRATAAIASRSSGRHRRRRRSRHVQHESTPARGRRSSDTRAASRPACRPQDRDASRAATPSCCLRITSLRRMSAPGGAPTRRRQSSRERGLAGTRETRRWRSRRGGGGASSASASTRYSWVAACSSPRCVVPSDCTSRGRRARLRANRGAAREEQRQERQAAEIDGLRQGSC